MLKPRFWMLLVLTLSAAASRLIPHPPNFTPIVAMALFGGAQFSDKRSAFLIVFGALLLSDLVIGFHSQIIATYGCMALIVGIGFWLRQKKSAGNIVIAALASSILFFIVSNFGVWFIDTLYPKTLNGLIECFAMALPFFRNTLAGDMLFTVVLFGMCALFERVSPAFRDSRIVAIN